MLFPTHTEIGWTLIAVAGIASASVELNQRRPDFFPRLARIAGRKSVDHLPDQYMRLSEACNHLFDEVLGTPLRSKAISHGGRTMNGVLDWLAFRVAGKGVTIYGRHPSTGKLHPVPQDHFQVAGVRGGAAEMVRDGFSTYIDLAVKRLEFEAKLDDLKADD